MVRRATPGAKLASSDVGLAIILLDGVLPFTSHFAVTGFLDTVLARSLLSALCWKRREAHCEVITLKNESERSEILPQKDWMGMS